MLGLFGLLNLGSRALTTQRAGVEVAGQNLANVNNPAYARQRLSVSTSLTIPSEFGTQGTGVEATGIVQIRSDLLDAQIQEELSVRGSLEAQQAALQYAESDLGEQLDRTTAGASVGSSADVGTSHSLADRLADLFGAFQSLSTNPASLSERQAVLSQAANLAVQFNSIDKRLSDLNTSLNGSVTDQVGQANALLTEITQLNDQISQAEIATGSPANDLRDLRESRIENLARLVKLDVSPGANGTVDIAIAGTLMVSGNQLLDTLQAYDPGDGQLLVRATNAGTPLNLTGGAIQGTIEARDGGLADLRNNLDALASVLITEVNAVHAGGYSLTGSTGTDFFLGTNAGTIQVNPALLENSSLLQAAGEAGAPGDNRVAVALAQLAQKAHLALGGQTFSQKYVHTASAFGQAIASVQSRLSDQQVVERMLLQQRESVSGVSLDEEMTSLTSYQRAFQASARLITTVDELFDTVVNLKH